MTFSSRYAREEHMREMAERAVRFTPYPATQRIDPVMEIEAMLELPERQRPPLYHARDKPIEQVLREEMACYDVPL